jgi:pyridoxamine 5'-phosphate oxidase
MGEAKARGIDNHDAMALATATSQGIPSVRIVLCRWIDDDEVRFFTNYESRKGRELDSNPHAAAVFHWRELERQVKLEGEITRTSAAVSDAYFAARPRGNRIAAWASPQSQVIASKEELRSRYEALTKELDGKDVPRPRHWGGYAMRVSAVELWVADPVRLHECIRFERPRGEDRWEATRRAP